MWIVLSMLACGGDSLDSGALEAGFSPPDQAGPYPVGVKTLDVIDVRGKALRIEVWYPAVPAPGDEPDEYDLPLLRDAYRGAPAADGAFPLVGFSHGLGGIRYQSAFLTEHLASHGYIVGAVDHTYTTILDMNESKLVQGTLERPDDVRYMIDALIADAQIGPIIEDPNAYRMIGHSLGAVTTLMLANGQLDPDALGAHCTDRDDRVCRNFQDFTPEMLDEHGFYDARVVANVPITPGLWYMFGPSGAHLSSTANTLILASDKDQVLDYETEARPVYDALGGPKRMATFLDAGHYAYTEICEFVAPLFEDCEGPEGGYIDLDRAKILTNTTVTAFLKSEAEGDARYTEWIEVEAPELTWESFTGP
ncbi:MAG: hypothetical protein AAFV53_02595 [Myxococcota bacterium]